MRHVLKVRGLGAAFIVWGMLLLTVAPTLAQETAEDTIWQVRGIHIDGDAMEIKAVGREGKLHDIVAIQHGENLQILDVKALIKGKQRPVKVLVADERYAPVTAIDSRGRALDLVAITPSGRQLDVKAVRRVGTILQIKAIGMSRYFDLQAIAPDGTHYDIKGVKLMKQRSEMVIGTVQVHAHVKALPPTENL